MEYMPDLLSAGYGTFANSLGYTFVICRCIEVFHVRTGRPRLEARLLCQPLEECLQCRQSGLLVQLNPHFSCEFIKLWFKRICPRRSDQTKRLVQPRRI